MDQQKSEILKELEFHMNQIRNLNLKLEEGEHVEQDDLDKLSNDFHHCLSFMKPSDIPDPTTLSKIQQLIKAIIEHLEVFLLLVGADPDEKIGLSEERIAKFNDFKGDVDETGLDCPVCVKLFKGKGEELVMLDCEHIVHKKCAKDWFADLNFCPNCNQVFT